MLFICGKRPIWCTWQTAKSHYHGPYLTSTSSPWDAAFFLNTLKSAHFSTQAVKDYVDFVWFSCLHLHLFLELELKEIIGNLCSTLAWENKHLVFANSHRKVTARRRNFTTLFDLKDNEVHNEEGITVVHHCMCWGCSPADRQTPWQQRVQAAEPRWSTNAELSLHRLILPWIKRTGGHISRAPVLSGSGILTASKAPSGYSGKCSPFSQGAWPVHIHIPKQKAKFMYTWLSKCTNTIMSKGFCSPVWQTHSAESSAVQHRAFK